jgi:hypothetical protein
MASELEQVADALCQELVDGSFSMDFAPEVTFDAAMRLEDAETLHVDVVPVRSEPERQTRGQVTWTNYCDIGIRYRFGTSHQDSGTGKVDNAHVHLLLELEQEIVEAVYSVERLTNYPSAVIAYGPEVRVGWVPKHMVEWNQFTGIVRVGFRTETEIA